MFQVFNDRELAAQIMGYATMVDIPGGPPPYWSFCADQWGRRKQALIECITRGKYNKLHAHYARSITGCVGVQTVEDLRRPAAVCGTKSTTSTLEECSTSRKCKRLELQRRSSGTGSVEYSKR